VGTLALDEYDESAPDTSRTAGSGTGLGAGADRLAEATLDRDFLAACSRGPERVAVQTAAGVVRYAELARLVERACGEVSSLSELPAGSVVACSLGDPVHLLALVYACARLGLIACPLDPRLKPAERERLLRQVQEADADVLAHGSDGLPEGRPWIARHRPLYLDDTSSDALFGNERRPSVADSQAHGKRLFYLGLTSGSTGLPKGVLRTQASWATSFRQMTAAFGLQADDHVLLGGSLAHSFFLTGALHALSIGAEVICLEKFIPARLIDAARRWRASVLYLVPSMATRLVAEVEGQAPLDSVRAVIAAGARWRPEERRGLQAHLPSTRLIEYYGSSEMGFVSLCGPVEFAARPESVGRAFPGVEISIRDEHGRELGPGEVGFVHARGPMTCAGLLEAAEHTPWSSSGTWVSSADRGWLDADGYLYLAGREDDQINVGGLKVFAVEVEQALLAHPDVADAVVMGLDDARQGQVVGAVVEPRPGARLSERQVQAWLRARLSPHKLPRRLLLVQRLPRTLNGKLARTEARRMLGGEASEARREGPPSADRRPPPAGV
jgi:long-chain acyl-CoA synthetase